MANSKNNTAKEFSCPQCNDSFTKKGNCDYHIKSVHAENRPRFQCPDCDKSYLKKGDLTRHGKVHQGLIQPCPECHRVSDDWSKPHRRDAHVLRCMGLASSRPEAMEMHRKSAKREREDRALHKTFNSGVVKKERAKGNAALRKNTRAAPPPRAASATVDDSATLAVPETTAPERVEPLPKTEPELKAEPEEILPEEMDRWVLEAETEPLVKVENFGGAVKTEETFGDDLLELAEAAIGDAGLVAKSFSKQNVGIWLPFAENSTQWAAQGLVKVEDAWLVGTVEVSMMDAERESSPTEFVMGVDWFGEEPVDIFL